MSITNGIVSYKINDRRNDFNFGMVNFPFLDGDGTRSPSYCVYILQNLFVLQEYVLMLVSSTADMNLRLLSCQNKVTDIIISKLYHRNS